MIDKTLWVEPFGHVMREHLLLQAKRRHSEHQPPLTMDVWKAQRAQLLVKIRENIGVFPADRCPLDVKEYGRIDCPTYTITKITYQSRPGLRVTANLYVPKGDGPFPGILVVHGHWTEGKASPRVQSRCQAFAADGFVVLAVDAFGSGERATNPGEFEYHGANIGSSLLNIGESLCGLQIYDNMRGIDLLQSLACVDGEKIGVTGASGGGNQTMWVSALDERVKAAVPVVSVGTFEAYVVDCNCICELLPNGLTFMEEWGALGLIAPNALLILNSLQDPRPFAINEMARSFASAREVFDLYGVGDKIAYQAINLPHGYWPEMQRYALGWFRRWLRGEGEGRHCHVTENQPLAINKLLVFPEKNRPMEVQSIYEFSHPIAKSLAAGHLAKGSISAEEKRQELRSVLRTPAEAPYFVGKVRQVCEDGIDISCFLLEIEPGVPLPVELYSKSGIRPEKAVLAVHHEGMGSIPRDELMTLLNGGQAVALTDLRNSGMLQWDREMERSFSLPYFHDSLRTTIWLGRTMIGEWAHDLITVAEQLKAICGVKTLNLLAYRDAGIAALCAATLSDQFTEVTVYETMASYVPEKCYFRQSMAVHIPKILHWGDVSMMASLANAKVNLLNPTRTGGGAYSAEEIIELEQELTALAEKLNIVNHVSVKCGTLIDCMCK